MMDIWSVGKSIWDRWEVRKAKADNPNSYTIVEYLKGARIKDAAIECDGTFTMEEGGTFLSMNTTLNKPNLYIVTETGNLYWKIAGDPNSSLTLLAIEVEKVSVCQGWASVPFDKDMGLWIVYLKKSRNQYSLCYRVYYRENDPIYISYEEIIDTIEVEDGQEIDVEVRRLNDYRIGIYLTEIGRLYITERTYIGNTAKTEMVFANVSVPFLSLVMRDNQIVADDKLQILSTERASSDTLVATFNYPIFDGDPGYSSMIMSGNLPEGQGIESFKMEDNKLIIKLKKELVTDLAEIKMTILPGRRFQYEKSSQARPVWEIDEIVFASEPIKVTEVVNTDITAKGSLIMTQKKDYYEYMTETVYASVSAKGKFNMIQIQDVYISEDTVNKLHTEIVYADIKAVGELKMIQSGVSPI